MLYFAYGANLNLRNIKRHAPRAKPLCAALLAGYRLVFRRFADITLDPKSEVRGALYELTPGCVRNLDAYEGSAYRKITVSVKTDEGMREAMAYVMSEGEIAPPDIAYYNVVSRGYADWKLDTAPLRRARYATIKR